MNRVQTEHLVHYGASPVLQVRSAEQSGDGLGIGKPNGLWVSVEGNGDGWREWCIAEEFNLVSLTHVHDVLLAPSANVLRLTDASEIDAFTFQFLKSNRQYSLDTIDWNRVARVYQGIIIAPYVWQRRLSRHSGWYYGWDCASGCIWDAATIASVTLREVAEPDRAITNAERAAS